jgi:hypothetical protein
MRQTVILYTAFGPGRPWLLPMWIRTVNESGLDLETTRVVIADNTNDPSMRSALVLAAAGLRPCQFVLLPMPYAPPVSSAKAVAAYLAYMWNRASEFLEDPDSEFFLSLEPDVVPAAGAAGQLLASCTGNVRVAGCAVRSRHWKHHVMAYGTIPGAEKLRPLRRLEHYGIRAVSSVNLGCTVVKAAWLRSVRLSGVGWEGRHGHDLDLCRQAVLDGGSVVCDFSIRTEHYDTPDIHHDWVPAINQGEDEMSP